MHRRIAPPDPNFNALQDERDHLKIRVSLMMDAERRDHQEVQKVLSELADIEKQLTTARRSQHLD